MLGKLKNLSRNVQQRATAAVRQAASRIATSKSTPSVKPGRDDYIVALDIGTEYVKALIGKIEEGDIDVKIIGVGRAHQSLTDMQAGAISDIAGVVANWRRSTE